MVEAGPNVYFRWLYSVKHDQRMRNLTFAYQGLSCPARLLSLKQLKRAEVHAGRFASSSRKIKFPSGGL